MQSIAAGGVEGVTCRLAITVKVTLAGWSSCFDQLKGKFLMYLVEFKHMLGELCIMIFT